MKKKYNTSIVLPLYKKYNEFMYAMNYNYEQFELMDEIIIIIDENADISRLSYLQNYNINFKLFKNTENHEWRNPAIVINFGIKQVNSKYCIIMSPETILMRDALKNLILNCDDNSFCLGSVCFLTYDNYEKIDTRQMFLNETTINELYIGPLYFGSICCSKQNFEKVNYYNEKFNFSGWGEKMMISE